MVSLLDMAILFNKVRQNRCEVVEARNDLFPASFCEFIVFMGKNEIDRSFFIAA